MRVWGSGYRVWGMKVQSSRFMCHDVLVLLHLSGSQVH